MPRRSAQQSTDRWVRKMQGATQDYTEGVQSVTQAPGQAAARNVAGYQNGVNQAIASGKWAKNVAGVSLDDWKRTTIEKGASRLAAGAAAAAPKVLAAQERVGAMVDSSLSKIANMPRSNPQERMARSAAFQLAMHQAGQNGRR